MPSARIAASDEELKQWFRENAALGAKDIARAPFSLFGLGTKPSQAEIEKYVEVPGTAETCPMPRRAFGIEIEGFFLGYGVYTAFSDIESIFKKNDAKGWNTEGDISIHPPKLRQSRRRGGPLYRAYEITTPKLSGEDGLDEYLRVARDLYRAGFRANNSCGLHLHADMWETTLDQHKNLVAAFQKNKKTYGSYIARHRRRNFFCKPNKSVSERLLDAAADRHELLDLACCRTRYSWANYRAAFERHKSCEYRGKEGQAYAFAEGYIRQIMNFTDTALDNRDARLPTLAELQAMTPAPALAAPARREACRLIL